MKITLKMFRCPPQNCKMAQYFGQPFPKPGRNVFTVLSILSLSMRQLLVILHSSESKWLVHQIMAKTFFAFWTNPTRKVSRLAGNQTYIRIPNAFWAGKARRGSRWATNLLNKYHHRRRAISLSLSLPLGRLSLINVRRTKKRCRFTVSGDFWKNWICPNLE